MRARLDPIIRGLVLVRLGQELGTDCELTQGIARAIDALLHAATRLFG